MVTLLPAVNVLKFKLLVPSKLENTALPDPKLVPVSEARFPEPALAAIVISLPSLDSVLQLPATSDLNLNVLATLLANIPSLAAVTPKFCASLASPVPDPCVKVAFTNALAVLSQTRT